MNVSPDIIAPIAEQRGFKKRSRTNFVREVNDVTQLVNVQKSSFSDDWYVNFAVWPMSLGKPDRLAEHLFPLRARVEDVLGLSGDASLSDLDRFFDVIDDDFSSVETLKSRFSRGDLEKMYVAAKVRALLAE